jgi:hypothetical protein
LGEKIILKQKLKKSIYGQKNGLNIVSEKKIAIVILHGVGDMKFCNPHFADVFISKVKDYYQELGGSPTDLVFQPVTWGLPVQHRQDELWDQLTGRGYDLRLGKARKMMIDFIFDGFAYMHHEHPQIRSAYDSIHNLIDESLHEVAEKAGPDAHLCFVGHSMGTCIIPTYVKLRHFQYASGVKTAINPLEGLQTLEMFYSMGSPYPWMAIFEDEQDPISKEWVKYGFPMQINRWVNFYDKQDILSYPIGFLNEYYQKAVIDVHVDVGSFLTKWNIASHLGYLEDEVVCRPIAHDFYAFLNNQPYLDPQIEVLSKPSK